MPTLCALYDVNILSFCIHLVVQCKSVYTAILDGNKIFWLNIKRLVIFLILMKNISACCLTKCPISSYPSWSVKQNLNSIWPFNPSLWCSILATRRTYLTRNCCFKTILNDQISHKEGSWDLGSRTSF